jgi:WD40 repeat protein
VGSVVNSVAFSPDGKTLAYGDNAGQVVLYDLASEQSTTLKVGSVVNSVAFSPDGKTLAYGDNAGQVVLYDLASKRTTTLNALGSVESVTFSLDGKTLASGDDTGRVVLFARPLWTSTFAQLRLQLCRELGAFTMTRSDWAAYVPDQPYERTCP